MPVARLPLTTIGSVVFGLVAGLSLDDDAPQKVLDYKQTNLKWSWK